VNYCTSFVFVLICTFSIQFFQYPTVIFCDGHLNVELEIKPSLNAKLIPPHAVRSATPSAGGDGSSDAPQSSGTSQLEQSATPADK